MIEIELNKLRVTFELDKKGRLAALKTDWLCPYSREPISTSTYPISGDVTIEWDIPAKIKLDDEINAEALLHPTIAEGLANESE